MTREPDAAEVERRYERMRAAMAAHDVDALLVSGSEYSGFEGAVRYMSGFRIVHRYAYVLLWADGEALSIFPSEARYVGEHAEGWIRDPVFAEHPGAWLAEELERRGVRRLGVYGLAYVMAVRGVVRARRLRRGLRPRPRRQERGRARARARVDGDQRGRLLGGAPGL